MNKFVNERLLSDFFQEEALSQNILKEVLRFHQSTNFLLGSEIKTNPFTMNMLDWAKKVENRDTIPSNSPKILYLSEAVRKENSGSHRNFVKDEPVSINSITRIFNKSFGRSENGSKNYPSAGGLYPILPILLVFSSSAITDIKESGSYLYDGDRNALIQLKAWESEELTKVKKAIHPHGDPLSNLAMVYSMDIKKSITKYRLRGYRHGLIEAGLISQSFIDALNEDEITNWGQCLWSGYNDNLLTKMVGLNVRDAPLVIAQWFGIKGELSNDSL
ncbi:hypothetical protein GCM10007063_32480 [Lentibacillus kapialis]|uniref:Nitroreductase domain-containing protein n=1 Tax=Lentibacillus kapialis TaxID=340214 RepID=A0A917Q1Q2_9BACI|nr:hypothetical protein [Lentibacillus kapialis]GGK07469.1 hypothetical protein GCM10007063_32480 [Lentibacillus kapialis]